MLLKAFVFIFVVLFFPGICSADTLYLKNGKKVEGQILEETPQSVKISVRGITLTYDAYDIERSEKSAFPSADMPLRKADPGAGSPVKTAQPQVIRPSSEVPSGEDKLQIDVSLLTKNKNQLILDLIDASGARDNMTQMFSQILSQASPQDSEKLRMLFNVDEIISKLVPIYDKYFTEEELRELVTFYRSVLGRKLLMTTPQIMQDSMEVSMAYFQKKLEGVTLSQPEGQPQNAPGQSQ